MRVPDSAGALAVIGLLATGAAAEELPSPLTLDGVVAVLRAHNPELRARRADAEAAAARPRGAAQLDDPMVSLEWWQQPIDFATIPLMITLRQPLPWPGLLGARKQASLRQAATARDAVGEAEQRLEADAKRALLDVALAERTLAVNARVHTLLEAMVQVADAKYRVGKAAQAQMLEAQQELLTNENERLDLERDHEAARARLDALLDRATDAALPTVALPTAPVVLPSEAELVALATANRPEVRLAKDAVAEAEARLGLARRESNPELAVWASYMVNVRGVDTFTTGVSTTLPVFSSRRRSSSVAAGEAELAARRAALDDARRKAEADVRTALYDMDAAERHVRLHADKLIPLAELSLQSAQAAYQNDRIDFFSVLAAARMLRDHHLDHARYAVEYERRVVDLERAIGETLPRKVAP